MTFAKILISAVLVWLCFRSVDPGATLSTLAGIHFGALIACVVCMIAHTLLCAWRWRLVCRELGLADPGPRNAVRWTALSVMLSQVLPSTIGGDAYRIGALGRQQGFGAATRSVVHDRLFGLWVLAGVAGLAAIYTVLSAGWINAVGVIGALAIGFVVAIAAAAWVGERWPGMRRLGRMHALTNEAAGFRAMLRSPTIVAASFAIHLMTIAAMAALCLGVRPASGLWWQIGLLTPAAMLAAAIPISIAGWGVREAALLAGVGAFAIAQSDALAVSVAYGLMLLVTGALGALVWASVSELGLDVGPRRRPAPRGPG